MKYFISQPMNGKSEEEILNERNTVIQGIKAVDKDAIILDSYFEEYNPDKGCIPLKYLSKSLEILADADVAVFLKGWTAARGCQIEHMCAEKYHITIREGYMYKPIHNVHVNSEVPTKQCPLGLKGATPRCIHFIRDGSLCGATKLCSENQRK